MAADLLRPYINPMRKLKLQVQMSVDGYIAGVNGAMEWMVWNWDDAVKNYVTEITEPVDCGIVVLNYVPNRNSGN